VVMPNLIVQAPLAADSSPEENRRPTVVPAPMAANPEISERPGRRTFTGPEKLRILKEADQAAGTGAIGAILRRHGLYSSALSEWRRQREAGVLGALTPAKRGPKLRDPNPLSAELAGVQRENAQLRRRLERAEAIIEVQKKLADLLGIPLAPIESDSGS
jgi:transposase